MKIYHATFVENIPSIREHGVCVRFARGMTPAVWGVEWSGRFWSLTHVVKRHGWPRQPPVLIELEVDEDTLRKFKGNLYFCLQDWKPDQIVRIWTWDEVCGSPAKEGDAA